MSSGDPSDVDFYAETDEFMDGLSDESDNDFLDGGCSELDDPIISGRNPEDKSDAESDIDDRPVFKVWALDKIDARVDRLAQEVKDMLGLSPGFAKILLNAAKWNSAQLIERYLEDQDTILAKVGLKPADIDLQQRPGIYKQAGPDFDCIICFSGPPSRQRPVRTYSLACGHAICTSCFETYAKTKLHERALYTIKCPGDFECRLLASEDHLKELGLHPQFQKYAAQLYVESCVSTIKNCPQPGCDNVVEFTFSDFMHDSQDFTVTCDCEHEFCFNCLEPNHTPLPCDLVSNWATVMGENARSARYVTENARPCPKCKSPIERISGCNHMTCTRCNHEWCWICMGEWRQHAAGNWSCAQFKPDAESSKKSKTLTRADVARINHYGERHDSNKTGRDVVQKLNHEEPFEEEMEAMPFYDLHVRRNARPSLVRARRALMWSYALLFYICPSNQKSLLEENVANLEVATEELADIILGKQRHTAGMADACTERENYVRNRLHTLLTYTTDTKWTWDNNMLDVIERLS